MSASNGKKHDDSLGQLLVISLIAIHKQTIQSRARVLTLYKSLDSSPVSVELRSITVNYTVGQAV